LPCQVLGGTIQKSGRDWPSYNLIPHILEVDSKTIKTINYHPTKSSTPHKTGNVAPVSTQTLSQSTYPLSHSSPSFYLLFIIIYLFCFIFLSF
jgi:hypothetical protein